MIKSLKKAALNHKTTLGKNDALPDMFDTSYEYGLLDKRFKEVEEELHKVDGLLNTDHDYLMEVLSRKFKECKDRERPIRHELERLCGETVVKMLGIPEGTMTIMCELVDEIRPNYKLRIIPADEDLVADNTQELGEIKKEVLKRRFINSLIQGISYSLMKDDETYLRPIYKIDKELLSLYEDIVRINDYILFTTNIKIDENNTIGRGYGYQIAKFNQIDKLIETLKTNPQDRRMLMTMWNIEDLPHMTLQPCCFMTMWDVTDGRLNCMLIQRSGDVPLGVPFNTSQYAVLVHLIAQVTGLKPGLFTHVINNAHIYENQVEGMKLQLTRANEEYEAPKLWINPEITNFYDFTADDIKLIDYKYHPAIKMEVSV